MAHTAPKMQFDPKIAIPQKTTGSQNRAFIIRMGVNMDFFLYVPDHFFMILQHFEDFKNKIKVVVLKYKMAQQ